MPCLLLLAVWLMLVIWTGTCRVCVSCSTGADGHEWHLDAQAIASLQQQYAALLYHVTALIHEALFC